MQLPPVMWEQSCYWCHPLIIFHSCFQYPAFYEAVFSSFMCSHLCAHVCANIDCANTSVHLCGCAHVSLRCVFLFVYAPTLITSLPMLVSLTTGALLLRSHWFSASAYHLKRKKNELDALRQVVFTQGLGVWGWNLRCAQLRVCGCMHMFAYFVDDSDLLFSFMSVQSVNQSSNYETVLSCSHAKICSITL